MSDPDLIQLYEPRQWAVYEIRVADEYRDLQNIFEWETTLKSCGGESQFAADHYKHHGSIKDLFFYDVEQILGMDLDQCYGQMDLARLTAEWRGHRAGSLVFVCAKGVHDGKFTVAVEKSA